MVEGKWGAGEFQPFELWRTESCLWPLVTHNSVLKIRLPHRTNLQQPLCWKLGRANGANERLRCEREVRKCGEERGGRGMLAGKAMSEDGGQLDR